MMDGSKGYMLGFTTLALAMFLGYLWSPDYLEFVSNGSNFLFIVGFGVAVFIMQVVVDSYYKKKLTHKSKGAKR